MSIAKINTTVGAVLHLAGIEAVGNPVSRSARYLIRSAAFVALGAASVLSLTGCGSNYRPVVAAINPVGPSAQPTKYAVAISSPSATLPGIVTLVDFSGDTTIITANIGVSPKYLVLAASGSPGYTINGDGTLTSFAVSPTLLTSEVLQTTLLSGAQPISIFPQGVNIYVTDPGRSAIGEYQNTNTSTGSTTTGTGTTTSTGTGTTTTAPTTGSGGASPLSLKQELSVSKPIYVVGIAAATRVYALSQGSTTASPGTAVGIDAATNTPLPALPVGANPVYGVMTADGKRAFIMNKGDGTANGTVSVINAQTNALDTFTAASPAGTSTIPVGVNPLWADFAPTLSEVVVANAGDGVGNGSLSIISIPLCSASTPISTGSAPNCDPNNPVDADGFGTVLKTVPVGLNPVMVAVLQDGTRAYVANTGNGTTLGSVSVVNLTSNTVTATIPLPCHPSYIAATTGVPTGKVYVVCPDSQNMTVIRTDIDAIDTSIPLQGNGVSVRVSLP